MNNDLILYNHGGSGNHGCEAIVRSLTKITNVRPVLFSYRPDEDFKYGLNDIGVSIHGINNVSGVNPKRIYLYFSAILCIIQNPITDTNLKIF